MSSSIHRRQFLIGPGRGDVPDHWVTVALAAGVVLSHCPTLPVAPVRDGSGTTWHLLGTAIQTDPARPDPVDDVAGARSPVVVDRSDAWAGRWLLLGDGVMYPDASSLLGCYYASSDGTTWISSSTALLTRQRGVRTLPHERAAPLRHGTMNWFPPPAARYQAVSKLLPSETLEVRSGKTSTRRLLPKVVAEEDYVDVLEQIEHGLMHALRRAAARGGTVWVPLSAGYDSRLVLALALSAGLDVKTYTWRKVNDWWNAGFHRPKTSYTLKSDMTLPPEIAAAAGVEHRWIERGEYDPQALARYDEHADRNTLENDRTYYSHGQWDWCKASHVILRGGVFEVGHCFYQRKVDLDRPAGEMPDGEAIMRHFHVEPGTRHAHGLEAWVRAVRRQPSLDIDWRERMYIEQRLAGWLSALEQALDLVPGERIYAVNSRRMFSLLLSLPREKRWNLQHHVDLISRANPALLDVPINPPEPWLRRRIVRALARIRRQVPWGRQDDGDSTQP